jgi:hypothetical protein
MKGQLSLEYLVLSVITLAVLALAIYTLAGIKNNSDKAMALLEFKNDANSIFNAAQDVCALGDGNSREVRLLDEMMAVSEDRAIEFSKNNVNQSLVFKGRCTSEINGKLEGTVVVVNENGVVKIRD